MPTAEHDSRDPLCWLPDEWAAFLAARGERPFRAMQVFRWIHRRGVGNAEEMTDLGKGLRAAIAETGLAMPAEVRELRRAVDGTQKGLVHFTAGGTVETVLIPPLARDDEGGHDEEDDEQARSAGASSTTEKSTSARSAARPNTAGARGTSAAPAAPLARVTQCISSQVGCAMGCVFCASGVAGLKRNLTAGEIVAQVLLGRRALAETEALRNVVLMGMGEPLHNYGNVARALRLLTHPDGAHLSTRRVTVSTSGLIPEIDRLGREFNGQVALAVSLHAPDDALRSSLMPINRRYPLSELIAALKRYPLPPRRRITIEYTLIQGINDGPAEARALARVLRDIPVKINLIPMNPIDASPYRMPAAAAVEAFQSSLRAAGYSVFVRKQRGDEIDAACGQLALRGAAPKKGRVALPTLPATTTRTA